MWVLASVWVGLALVATLVAIWFKISTALHTELGGKASWISFLAGTGLLFSRFSLVPNSIRKSFARSGKKLQLSLLAGRMCGCDGTGLCRREATRTGDFGQIGSPILSQRRLAGWAVRSGAKRIVKRKGA